MPFSLADFRGGYVASPPPPVAMAVVLFLSFKTKKVYPGDIKKRVF